MKSIFDSPEFNANLFFPRPDLLPAPAGKVEIFAHVDDFVHVHVRQYPFSEAKFSLIYFHGNGEIVSDYDEMEEPYKKLGAELMVCDYRGYGKSEGLPTLRNTLLDAHMIYETLRSKCFPKPVFIMGRSLGSASAIELCANHNDIAGCIIESGYADPIPLVERRGLKIQSISPEDDAVFNNSRKIAHVTCPLLIMHGAEDLLISPKEARLNFQQAGSRLKSLKILDGVGHNDIIMSKFYFPSLQEFFANVLGPV